MRRSLPALGFFLLLVAAMPARAATIAVDSPAFAAGDTFTVTVSITDVSDLFTFGFDLSFDDAVVTPTAAAPGPFLGGSFFFAIFPDEPVIGIPGTIQLISDTLIGPGPGVSGSGDLAFLTFLALAAGDAQFALSNIVLLDSAGGLIEVEVPTTVPEPALLSLLALGLIAARRRSRRV